MPLWLFIHHADTLKTVTLSKTVSMNDLFKRKMNCLLLPFARLHNARPLGRNRFNDNPTGFAQYHFHLSQRSNSIHFTRIISFKEEKERKIPSTYLSFFYRPLFSRATTSERHMTRKFHIRFRCGASESVYVDCPP